MELSEKEDIRRRLDLVEFISRYTALKRAGRTYKGLCPFHNERTPSFTVDPDRGSWHCWGACSTGGDIFAFLMKAENLTFIEAAERLATLAGVTLSRRGMDASEVARQRDERERLYSVNAEATRFYQAMLTKAKLAQDYVKERGLVHQTLQDFGIGFAPDEWSALSRYLGSRGYDMADAEHAGLNRPSPRAGEFTDKFRGRLIFPIYDVQERVVAFGGRIIPNPDLPEGTNQGPKYLNSPETPIFSKSRILYGLNRARKSISDSDRVLVVEGYMDVVAAHQAGIENVVATLGTSLTDDHIRILGRYTKNIILSFDSDEAGIRAALRAAELFQSHGPEFALRILAMPPGDDPDSMLRRGDIAGFRKTMDTAYTVPEFRLRGLEGRMELQSEQGRMEFLREAIPILAEVRSSLELDLLVRRLAPYHPAFGSGTRAEASILNEVQRWKSQRSGSRGPAPMEDVLPEPPPRPRYEGGQRRYPPRNGSGYPHPPRPEAPVTQRPLTAIERAERTVLCGFLSEDWKTVTVRALERASEALGYPASDLFTVPQTQALIDALLPLLSGRLLVQRALDQLTSQELQAYASQFLNTAHNDAPLSEESINDCVNKLAFVHPPRRIRQLQEKLTHSQDLTNDEMRELSHWMKAKKHPPSPEA